MTRILGVEGSPRKGGNSHVLLKHALQGARSENAVTDEVHLRDYQFQPCVGCERCRKTKECPELQDGMQLIYPKVEENSGLVLVSPTHFYNVTAWMKAFIDRLYCYGEFTTDRPRCWKSLLAGQGRKAAIMCVGEGVSREEAVGLTLEAMRLPLESLGYEVVGELPVLATSDRGLVRENVRVIQEAERLGAELARALRS